MEVALDIIIVILIILGTYMGARKGLLKSLVGLVGLIAIIIISYSLRIPLANILIDKLPFFEFSGALAGLTSLNILFYNIIAFVIIFILLYCVLNVIMSLTGFIDTLLKFTVIWVIPSKIGGALLGFIESWLFVFLALFILVQFNFTTSFVTDSKVGNFVLDHTPVVGNFLGGAKEAAKSIYDSVQKYTNGEIESSKEVNIAIINSEIINGLITKAKANELIETGKLELEGVMFG